jgi:hypothetical protein
MVNSRTTLGLKDVELFLHLFSAESALVTIFLTPSLLLLHGGTEPVTLVSEDSALDLKDSSRH